jgi:hypothetical protein
MRNRFKTIIVIGTVAVFALASRADTTTQPATSASLPAEMEASTSVPATASAPATKAAASGPTTAATTTQPWQNNPNIRILGLTPYQVLYIGIGALVVVNALALIVIGVSFLRAREEDAALARKQAGEPSQDGCGPKKA